MVDVGNRLQHLAASFINKVRRAPSRFGKTVAPGIRATVTHETEGTQAKRRLAYPPSGLHLPGLQNAAQEKQSHQRKA